MRKRRDLSPAEFEIMDVLWRLEAATVKQVQAVLQEERKLAYTTVSTQLNRLREKGYVDAREKNFAYEFYPLVPREQVVRRKLDELVGQILGGDVSPLAAYIAEKRNLTAEQIDALEQIVLKGKEEQ